MKAQVNLLVWLWIFYTIDTIWCAPDVEIKSAETRVGDETRLPCTTTTEPRQINSVEWFKKQDDATELFVYEWTRINGKETQNIHEQVKDHIDTIEHTTLRINNTRLQDGGTYSCVIAYDNKFHKIFFNLTVLNPVAPTTDAAGNEDIVNNQINANERGTPSPIVVVIVVVIIILIIMLIANVLICKYYIGRRDRGGSHQPQQNHVSDTDHHERLPLMINSPADTAVKNALQGVLNVEEKVDTMLNKMTVSVFSTLAAHYQLYLPAFMRWFLCDVFLRCGPLEGWYTANSVKRVTPTYPMHTLLTVGKIPIDINAAMEKNIIKSDPDLADRLVYSFPDESVILEYCADHQKTHDHVGLQQALGDSCNHKWDQTAVECAPNIQKAYKEALKPWTVAENLAFSPSVPSLIARITVPTEVNPITLRYNHFNAIRFEGWPDSTSEWKFRHRAFWPHPNVLQCVSTMPCYLIRSCAPFSGYEDTKSSKWFLSFAVIEKMLAAILTIDQKTCYLAFKLIYYNKLVHRNENEPILNAGNILPYDIPMTLMFRFLEEASESTWEQPLKEVLREVLRKLSTCVERNILQHYFVAHVDIFSGHVEIEALKASRQMLSEIIASENPLDYINLDELEKYYSEISKLIVLK